MPRSLFPLALAGLVLAGASVRGEDWPEFRGPTGQGHARADDLVTQWSATRNVVWKSDVPGSGWSSPVVVAGRVYLTSAVEIQGTKDLSLRAFCLDAKDGKILWSQEVFREDGSKAPRIHSKNSHASPTPIVSGTRLYVHFGHEGTACLDLSGKILWTYRDPYPPVHGNGGSPILVDDLLVFSTDGKNERRLVALNAEDGKVRWKAKRSGTAPKNFSFSTALAITVNGKKQIISPSSNVVGAYDPGTGKEIWHVRYTGYSVIPRPVYGHGLVFLSTSYDSPTVLAIRPDGQGDVTDTHVKWSLKKGAPHTPSLLLIGEELYMVSDNGLASCVDAKTGKVHWSKRLSGKGYSASPIAAGGRVYFLAENGVGTVVKAGKTFELVSNNDIGERTLASYAVSDGALFLRTASKLYRLGK
jgi:outer membrane protein assembly factor BamB